MLYKGAHGTVAHECIVDTRVVKSASGVEVEDIAKRLMDYGFHAPTVSFPVAGTLMIEPTESESLAELDRFCDAMISIREEIREIEKGVSDRKDNVAQECAAHAGPRDVERVDPPVHAGEGGVPGAVDAGLQFWPAVARVESAYGDRNLICSCPPTDAYADAPILSVAAE